MTAWRSFTAMVEPIGMGRATYTVIRLPDDIAEAFRAEGVKRVEGEINEHPVNLALSRTPEIAGTVLWAGKSLLDRVGLRPGQQVDIRLRPAVETKVEPPADVALALRAAERLAAWEALTPGKRRGLLYQIETAKTAPTRAKRIAAMIEGLEP